MLKPDIVVMDISMPEMSGLELARLLKENPPAPPVVFVTVHEDPNSWKRRRGRCRWLRGEVDDGDRAEAGARAGAERAAFRRSCRRVTATFTALSRLRDSRGRGSLCRLRQVNGNSNRNASARSGRSIGSSAGRRENSPVPACSASPCRHPASTCRSHPRNRKSRAAVIRACRSADHGVPGAAVLHDVLKRLLNNSEQAQRRLGRHVRPACDRARNRYEDDGARRDRGRETASPVTSPRI